MPFKVDRIEYLSGDRHLYGTATRHRRGDPGHRPAAGHGPDPDRRRRDARVRRARPTGCGSSTPKAGTGPTPSRSGAEAMDAATTERPGVRAGEAGPALRRQRAPDGDLVPAAVDPVHRRARGGAVLPGHRLRLQRRDRRRPQLRVGRPAHLRARPRRPRVLALAAQHLRLHRGLDGPDRGPRQGPGHHPDRRLPRQVAGPVPGPAALDDAGGPVGDRLAVDAGLGLQPDRLGAAQAWA